MGAELTERTIPAEAGVVERSVSFTKGCFTGQELVARIDSRGGNVPRHLRLLESDDDLPVGADVLVDGQPVGEITSSARGVALAYVGRAVTVPADATVAGAPVRVEAAP
jgi:folate-binding protein YgfZ